MHLTILDTAGLQVDTSRAGDTEWCDRYKLFGSSRSSDSEFAHGVQRPRMEKILGVRRAHKRPQRC